MSKSRRKAKSVARTPRQRRRSPARPRAIEIALAGFAHWASAECERLGVATVHCLLREGAVIADLMSIARPAGPATRLVHASRWALVRATVFDGTGEEIFPVIERRTMFRPEHLAAAFDLDLADVRRVLPHESYRHDQRLDAAGAQDGIGRPAA